MTYFPYPHLHREGARHATTRPLRLSSPACPGKYLAGPMTAGLVGANGFAAIPTTAIDLPLVQRLRRSPRFRVRVPIEIWRLSRTKQPWCRSPLFGETP